MNTNGLHLMIVGGIIIALALLYGATTHAKTVPGGMNEVGGIDGIRKYYDADNDVVCYIYFYRGGISCLKNN